MSNQTQPAAITSAPPHSVGAAFLSYLVPGLGQIVEGRVGKGLLFFVCIYGLFFYGIWLGRTETVFLPDPNNPKLPTPNFVVPLEGIFKSLYYRPQYLGQFWVGVAAWPALWQYARYDENQVGGVLLLKTFQRYPGEDALNAGANEEERETSLGWVYTVIAGVLNVLVIYDALAGPAFARAGKKLDTSDKNDNLAAPASR